MLPSFILSLISSVCEQVAIALAAMFCEFCDMLTEENFVFCQGCRVELNREEVILTNYFEKGFQYEKILVFLAKFHDISMSLRTPKSRLKSYGLSRRSMNVDEELVRRRIHQELDGPGCLHGYRAMWHTLKRDGVFVQRHIMEHLLREIDPEECSYRRAKHLRRRNYVSMGPKLLLAHGWV